MDAMKQKYPIILIHAFPLDATMWTPVTERLRSVGHTVHTPGLPGFGSRFAWPVDTCSIEGLADDIHALILEQPAGTAIVGGCSIGGYILLALLRRHPAAVRAAIFLDTHAAADPPEMIANRKNVIAKVKLEGIAPLAQSMAGRLLSASAPEALRSQVAVMITRQSANGVIGLQQAMAKRADQSDLLPKLTIPMLFVVGAEDQITPPAVMRAMVEQCTLRPAPELVRIPAAGHLAALEQPELVANVIDEFVQHHKCV